MDGMGIPAPPEGAMDGVGRSRARIVDLAIDGMTCASCVGRVERALSHVEGVLSVAVNLATEHARVSVSAGRGADKAALAARLQDAVHKAGYGGRLLPPEASGEDAEMASLDQRERLHLLLACLLSAPLLVAMLLHVGASLLHQDALAARTMLPGWLQFLLATPVQFWLGWRFYRAGAVRGPPRQRQHGPAGGARLECCLGPEHRLAAARLGPTLYFESSSLIITFILFGKWLERGARRRAASSVRALTGLRPDTGVAARCRQRPGTGGATWRAPNVGDLLVVRPGGRIAADGTGVGTARVSVDEQLLTGESRAVAKAPRRAR